MIPSPKAFVKRSVRISLFSIAAAGLFAATAQAQLTINDDLVVGTDPDPNGQDWDYTDGEIGIGVGAGQTGSLTVPAGESLLYLSISLGQGAVDATGSMTITGTGALVESSRTDAEFDSNFYVGEDGVGDLLIADGGTLTRRLFHVGLNPGSVGTVTVDGADSTLGGAGNWAFRVGQEGTGTVNATNGATINNVFTYFIGNLSGGDGTLNLSSGSSFTSTGSGRLGNNAGSVGQATITGPGTTFTSGNFLHVGSSGDGTLEVLDGATASIGGTLTVGGGGSADTDVVGHVHVAGTGSSLSTASWLYVGRNGIGTMLVEDGAQVNTLSQVVVGRETTGDGNLHVRGTDTLIDIDGYFYVGWDGEAALLVEEGGSIVSTGSFRVGRGVDSVGVATVRGENSSVISNEFIHVGGDGQGTLNIEDGGLVHTTGSVSVSREAGSSGDVLVSGAGSVFSSDSFFRVGRFDNGSMLVENGGQVVIGAGDFTVGSAGDAHGATTVTGMGSQVTTDENIRLAFNGTGELNILNGGFASSGTETVIAANNAGTGATGELLVDGTGSVFSVGTDLWMGSELLVIEDEPDQIVATGGQSLVTVQNGGVVNVTGDAIMRGASLLHLDGGDMNVGGVFDAVDPDGILRYTLNNPSNGTIFSDTAVLDGLTLEITLTYQPELDDVFVLLDAENGITGFLSYEGATLSEGGTFSAANDGFEQMFSISYNHGGGDVIALTAIPEPSTWAFIAGVSVLGLLFVRHLRNKA